MSPGAQTPSDALIPLIRVHGDWINLCSRFRAPSLTGVKSAVPASGLKPSGETLDGIMG